MAEKIKKEEVCKKLKEYIEDEAKAEIEYTDLSTALKELDQLGLAAGARVLSRDEISHRLFLTSVKALLECAE